MASFAMRHIFSYHERIMALTILLFLFLLSVLVLAHEFGHYIAARKSGMKVEEFGIGFPPRMFAWKGRHTTWSVNLIPLGGFVRIKGESGEDADRDAPDSFARKPLWKRFIVLVAGVVMNLVTAALIFTVGFLVGMPTVTEGGIPGGIVENQAVHVLEVMEDFPAAEAGLEVGDRLLTIDGATFASSDDARVALGEETAHEVVLARGEEILTVQLTPEFSEEAGKALVGVSLMETGTVRFPWYLAPVRGVEAATLSTVAVLEAFGGLLASIVTEETVDAELAGPVGIAVMTGEVAEMGFGYLLHFAAMLSINLAILNILPIPALDGGRVVFLAIEAIRRKPVTARIEQNIHAAGFAILLLLVLVVTFRDIVNLF